MKTKFYKATSYCLIVLLCVSNSGCLILGDKALAKSRPKYNEVVQQTAKEQMLLNIVRLKYREAPEFMAIPSVTESFSFSAGGAGSLSFNPFRLTGWGVSGNGSLAERPTISYIPLQDDQFNKRLLTNINLEVLDLLAETGWDISRVSRVIVKNINDVDNATPAGGPTPQVAPQFEEFTLATLYLRELQKQRLLEVSHGSKVTAEGVQTTSVRIQFSDEGLETTEAKRIAELLHLTPATKEKPFYELRAASGQLPIRGKQLDYLNVSARSFLEVLYFLSQAIEVPQSHLEGGLITPTVDEEGYLFDWSRVSGDLLQIHSCKHKPTHASVAIEYRGHWFYVDDRDLNSKSTFNLLLELYNITIRGGGVGQIPALTIGVGGN